MVREHSIQMMSTVEEVYGALNADPSVQYYGPTFRILQVGDVGQAADSTQRLLGKHRSSR